jgi:hypothetical protein
MILVFRRAITDDRRFFAVEGATRGIISFRDRCIKENNTGRIFDKVNKRKLTFVFPEGELNAVDVDAFGMIRKRVPDASGPLACSAAQIPFLSRPRWKGSRP